MISDHMFPKWYKISQYMCKQLANTPVLKLFGHALTRMAVTKTQNRTEQNAPQFHNSLCKKF